MSRCPLCPNRYNCVEGVGPIGAPILAIGEAPGHEEDRKRTPFVGKTGQEVDDTYLPLAGIRRPTIRIDNSISCFPDTSDHKLKKDNDKHVALLQSCANHHLYPYLRQHRPTLIIAMGAFACYAIDPEIELDLHHGIPLETKWGTVFPMFHPALGMHEAKKMKDIYTDWYRVGEYLKGRLIEPVDQYPNPDYQECKPYMVREIDPTIPMATDTEYSRSKGAYCLTYSQYPGQARLIMAGSPLLAEYQRKQDRWESINYFHNYLADWDTTGELGVTYKFKTVKDTMNRAFHLGLSRIGLKNIGYRKIGVAMTDFDDVVIPHSKPHVIEYIRDAYCSHEWPRPPKQITRDKDGMEKEYHPQSMKTKFKSFFTYLAKNPDKDVFKAWENWEDSWSEIEEKCGPCPGKDIAHVPFDEMLVYACRDADITLRVAPVLDQMVANAEAGLPQERW